MLAQKLGNFQDEYDRCEWERHTKKPKPVEGHAPTRNAIILVRYDSEMRHAAFPALWEPF